MRNFLCKVTDSGYRKNTEYGGAHKKTSYEFYTIMKTKLKYLNFKLAKKRHLKPGQMPKQI